MNPVISCKGCGGDTRNRAFCSSACQQEARQQALIDHWLATGEGHPHGRRDHWMRRYLLEAQRQLCVLCGAPQLWNGALLVFVMDHVDGDATNNRRENLRMICPNCNSQLPTHCGGNKGNGRRGPRYAKKEHT